MRLEGKGALVTGAGRGIGRAIALEFAGEGARVMVAEVDETSGRATVQAIEEAGGVGRLVPTDVTREEQVEAAVRAAEEAFARLDVMVNNAGVAPMGWENWELVMRVNVDGVFFGCRHAAQAMALAGGGVIVNLASTLGLVGVGPAGPYVASKHAVMGLTREFALQYAPFNVRVNAICPGWIETRMVDIIIQTPEIIEQILGQTPMGRLGKPEEVAKAAVFLACDDSSFMTGTPLIVDGGWTAR